MSKLDDLCDALDKAIGENHSEQSVTRFIDTGYPPLNYAISGRYDGGLPFGRMVEIFGGSSSGKTAMATEFMVQTQRMGGAAIFIDYERSFDVGLAKQFGLNTERPYWIYVKPRTWEEGNTILARAAKTLRESGVLAPDAPIIGVSDSIASAIPKSMLVDSKGKERGIDELTMNDTSALSRVTSTTLKVMAQHAEDFDATFVYLNQIRMKIGVMFGDPTTTPGGSAMEFYSTARLSIGREKIMAAVAGGKEFIGQNVKINVVKSKLTKPFKKAELRMMFDENDVARFDPVHSTLEFLVENKLIPVAGAYINWTDGKKYHLKQLAEKINKEGTRAELLKFLPSKAIEVEFETPTGPAEKEAA
jgi:recombination protein RecA